MTNETEQFEQIEEAEDEEFTDTDTPMTSEDVFGELIDPIEKRGRGRPTKIDPLTIEKTAREQAIEKAGALVFRLQEGNISDRQTRERKEQLLKALAELDDRDFQHMMADDEVQHAIQQLHLIDNAGQPGSPILDERGREISRVPYDAEWMMENYDMVEWTPMRTEVIEVNGVAWRVYENTPCKTPNVIRDVAHESYRQTRLANDLQRSILENSGPADGVSLVAGWRKLSNEELEAQPGNRRV